MDGVECSGWWQTGGQSISSGKVSQRCGSGTVKVSHANVRTRFTYPLHVSRQGADEGLVVEQVATASVGPRELRANPSPHTEMHGLKIHTRKGKMHGSKATLRREALGQARGRTQHSLTRSSTSTSDVSLSLSCFFAINSRRSEASCRMGTRTPRPNGDGPGQNAWLLRQ